MTKAEARTVAKMDEARAKVAEMNDDYRRIYDRCRKRLKDADGANAAE